MSLVNDMLRDLDQRRKTADGGSAHVPLTPAPEQYKEAPKQPIWLYLGIALLVAGGAIAYFWLQQSESDATRNLNIRTPVVVQPPLEQPDADELSAIAAASEESTSIGSTDTTTENFASNAGEIVEAAGGTNVAATSTNQPVEYSDAPAAEAEVETPVELVAEASETESIVESSVASTGVDAAEPDIASLAPASINKPVTTGESPVVDLQAGVIESVKNVSRMTSEEKDTLAVQEALNLIAVNNTTAAYQRLEQELLDNRYAHQSRETYAKLLMSQGDAYSALELTNSGLELAPNHSGYKKVKARLLMAAGDIAAACDLLIRRAPPIGEDIEYHDILATAQLANRDYEGALISYTSLVQQDQSQGKWWYGFAASQDSLGNSAAAKQGYSQAMQFSNLSPSLRRRSQERLNLLGQ